MIEKQTWGLLMSQKNSHLNSIAHLYSLARSLTSCYDSAIQWFSISVVSIVYEKHFNTILAIVFMLSKAEVPVARVAVLTQ